MNRPTHQAYLTLHAIGWLCVANTVGLLLGFMLLAPGLNQVLAPITYGRLIPVHLNGQLYGWCFLPLIGLLFTYYPSKSPSARPYLWSVDVWSLALGFGCLSWMAGRTSGKLFMEWSEASRVLLPAAMVFLAGALLISLIHERKTKKIGKTAFGLKSALWLTLLPVPLIMFWASSPTLFPPINPDSGGATGGDLLISSLGAITIMWLCPFMLRVPFRRGKFAIGLYILLQVIHYLAFAAMDHGDQSNYRPAEIIGLLTLLFWVPLLIVHFRSFQWPPQAGRWLWALAFWASFLVVSANVMFLPGFLDSWKFTHFVVGHTHAAMAGMLSAFNILVLIVINRKHAWANILGDRTLFWIWNLSTFAMVMSLKALGTLEGLSEGILFQDSAQISALFWLRLAAGVLMFAVSAVWLHAGLRSTFTTPENNHA